MIAGLWLWSGVPAAQAFPRVASDRTRLRTLPFARLLGVRRTTRPGPPDGWALLATAGDRAALEVLDRSPVVRGWDRRAATRTRLVLRPAAAHGSWGGRAPFAGDEPLDGPVLVLTRARVRPSRWVAFARAVPAVGAVPGLRAAVGIGEWPVGLLGTISLWDDVASMQRWARGDAAHRSARTRSRAGRWYAEELYARFAVLDGATGPLLA